MLQTPPIRTPKIILFTNWTDKDFTHTWNREPYNVKSGESIYLEDFKAELFAKHLVDRELNKKNLSTKHHTRKDMEKKCFSGDSITVSAEKTKEELLKLNKQADNELEKKKEQAANLKAAIEKEKEELKKLREEKKEIKKINNQYD